MSQHVNIVLLKCIQVELDHRDLLQEDEEFERENLVAEIAEELRPQHPQPEAFNLCVMSKEEQSGHFNEVLLKKLCHFEIPFKSRERKGDQIDKLSSFIQNCTCFSPSAQE